MSRRRRPAAILILGAAILALITVIGYRQTLGYWGRLRTAVESFGAPSGLTLASQREEGTSFCIITCSNGEAAIVVEYEATSVEVGVEEMCDRVGATAREHFRTVTVTEPYAELPYGLIGCVYAQMLDVGPGAYLQATGACFNRDNCISVVFSSGIE